MDRKCVKVKLYFDDGVKQTMEGQKATEWLNKINGMVMFAEIHNANPFKNSPVEFKNSCWNVPEYLK